MEEGLTVFSEQLPSICFAHAQLHPCLQYCQNCQGVIYPSYIQISLYQLFEITQLSLEGSKRGSLNGQKSCLPTLNETYDFCPLLLSFVAQVKMSGLTWAKWNKHNIRLQYHHHVSCKRCQLAIKYSSGPHFHWEKMHNSKRIKNIGPNKYCPIWKWLYEVELSSLTDSDDNQFYVYLFLRSHWFRF